MRSRLVFLAMLLAFISLTGSAQTTGTVITTDGVPVAGARIDAHSLESSADRLSRLTSDSPNRKVLASTKSDSGGRFVLTVKDHDVVNLTVEKDGFAPYAFLTTTKSDQGAIALRRAKLLTGMVRYHDKPLQDATVSWSNGDIETTVRTDAEGKYRVPDPSVWRASLIVYHAAAPVTILRDQPNTSSRVDVNVSELLSVRGKVLNADGSPAAGATVTVDGVVYAQSDAEGVFSIAHAPQKWNEMRALLGTQVAIAHRSSSPLALKLSPAAVLKGHVRDGKGRGIGSAVVRLSREQNAYGDTAVVADAQGNFITPSLVSGVYKIAARRPGFSTASGTLTLVAGTAQRDIILAPNATAIGVARDDKRNPVAGAVVHPQSRIDVPGAEVITAYTAPDGVFVLHGISGGTRRRLVGKRRAFPDGETEILEFKAGETKKDIVLTMPTGFKVSGRVTDVEGKPLSGVSVGHSVAAADWSSVVASSDVPQSSDDGVFDLHVPRGKYYFYFTAAGFARRVVEGPKVDADLKLDPVVLQPGTTLAGHTVRSGGAVAADVSVRISQDGRSESVRSGTDGSFRITGLMKAPLRINATAEDGATAVKDVDEPTANVILKLSDSLTIHGRVLDRESKRPLTDFEAGWGKAPFFSQKKSFHSDDGTFAVQLAREDGVQLVASAPGYSEERVDVDFKERRETAPVEISLSRAVRIVGTVTGPDGEPLASVSVIVLKRAQAGRGGTYVSLKDTLLTDAAGEYVADSIDTGLIMLQFVKEGFVRETKSLEAAGREQRVDAQLSRGTRLNGVVQEESGASIPDAMIKAMPSGGGPVTLTKSDMKGRFTLEPLGAGRHSINVTAAGYADEMLRDVDVADSPDLRVVLKQGVTLRGHIRGLDVADFPFVTVMIRNQRYDRKVDSAGAFTITDIAPGPASVSASWERGSARRTSTVKNVDVDTTSDVNVDIEFTTGYRVSGTVRRRTEPLEGAIVRFTPADGRPEGYASVRTNESGFYEAEGLIDGTYAVRVQDSASNPILGSTFTSTYEAKGSATFNIDVGEKRVAGRVIDAQTREPLAAASATLTTHASTISPTTSAFVLTDSNGRFVLQDAGSGVRRLIVKKRGYFQEARDLTTGGPANDDVEISLRKSSGTILRVTDARDGHPLDPIVTVFDAQGRAILNEMIPVDDGGSVRLDLSEGTYELYVRANQYSARPMQITIPGRELQVALTPGGALQVRVSSARKFRLRLRDGQGFFVRDPYSGEPSFVIEGSRTIPAVAPGSYTAIFEPLAGSVGMQQREVRIAEGQTAELVIDSAGN